MSCFFILSEAKNLSIPRGFAFPAMPDTAIFNFQFSIFN